MLNIVALILIIIILAWMCQPFLPSSCTRPSLEQRALVLLPKGAHVFQMKRESPIFHRNHVIARAVWPDDVDFKEWYTVALKERRAEQVSVSDTDVQAFLKGNGASARILVRLKEFPVVCRGRVEGGRVVHYDAYFK